MFFPQHFLGLAGHAAPLYRLSRRLLRLWNFWSSIGAYLSGVGTLVFLYVVYEAFARKRVAGDNPWGVGATTLEWTLPSPPPFHQYETLPRITGADH